MGIIDTIISNLQPDSPPKVSLYFKSPEDATAFKEALNANGVKIQTWQTEHGIAVKPLELPKFKEALATRGLMSDPYVQSVVDTLDKSANNYLEFRHGNE